ncbi:Zinc transporter ZIP9 [Tetrabaena socialis]|uniref:Zinc transporter ZIP9 n=1 Tax=Tetrabaena socialis TaxID=47790 RepID=A0A2J7ZSX0_9CHLO|nr:Zinc transporter ZIP9 [Tetrabaena socialis]|eukprot:PNH03374.1 Zinc transporter ZIP9 [Tetrabaena socialis]
MFVGALLTGLLPLWPTVAKTPGALQGPAVRMLSAGLMLGSGLGVVIPEGFHAFAQGHEGGLPEWLAGAALLAGFLGMLLLQLWLEEGTGPVGHGHDHGPAHAAGRSRGYTCLPSEEAAAVEHGRGHRDGQGSAAVVVALPPTWGPGGVGAAGAEAVRPAATADMELCHRDGSSGAATPPSRQPRTLDEEAAVPSRLLLPSAGGGETRLSTSSRSDRGSPQLALGGLLVHSAADGLAVGAASLGGPGPALTLAVAGAIMLHKLPVTLGLTAYLRAAGWPVRRVLQGLLSFSASAPAAALSTYYLAHLLLGASAGGSGGASAGQQLVAMAVLFSGGTFLAAATLHILPTALQSSGAGSMVQVRGATLLAVGAALPLLLVALLPEAD